MVAPKVQARRIALDLLPQRVGRTAVADRRDDVALQRVALAAKGLGPGRLGRSASQLVLVVDARVAEQLAPAAAQPGHRRVLPRTMTAKLAQLAANRLTPRDLRLLPHQRLGQAAKLLHRLIRGNLDLAFEHHLLDPADEPVEFLAPLGPFGLDLLESLLDMLDSAAAPGDLPDLGRAKLLGQSRGREPLPPIAPGDSEILLGLFGPAARVGRVLPGRRTPRVQRTQLLQRGKLLLGGGQPGGQRPPATRKLRVQLVPLLLHLLQLQLEHVELLLDAVELLGVGPLQNDLAHHRGEDS